MVLNYSQLETDIRVEEFIENIYEEFLRYHPEYRQLSNSGEEKILLDTLHSSVKELVDNFEVYLESYFREKLQEICKKAREKMYKEQKKNDLYKSSNERTIYVV